CALPIWGSRIRQCGVLQLITHYPTLQLRHRLALRHKHCETFACPSGLDEFAHRQFVAAIAAVLQRRDEPRRAWNKNCIASSGKTSINPVTCSRIARWPYSSNADGNQNAEPSGSGPKQVSR